MKMTKEDFKFTVIPVSIMGLMFLSLHIGVFVYLEYFHDKPTPAYPFPWLALNVILK
jgi:hypothetical protein